MDNYIYTLREFREKYPFSAKNLADLSGMNPTLIQQYMDGSKMPSKNQLRRVEDAVNQMGKELSRITLVTEK